MANHGENDSKAQLKLAKKVQKIIFNGTTDLGSKLISAMRRSIFTMARIDFNNTAIICPQNWTYFQ